MMRRLSIYNTTTLTGTSRVRANIMIEAHDNDSGNDSNNNANNNCLPVPHRTA